MKVNELISKFTIQLSNEENAVLGKMDQVTPLSLFSERDRFVIENLIRKSMVSKINNKGQILVVKNETQ